jgi:hypothetical protein
MDPRPQFSYKPGSPVGTQIKGLYDQTGLVDYIPFTAGSSAFNNSSATAPVAGTPITLVPIASNGAIQTTIIAPELGTAVSVIAIDSTASVIAYGTGGTIACWNPAGGTGRAITVTNSCNGNTESYIVRGRDMYGFKMTETIPIVGSSAGTGTGRKAFKYIQSITPSSAGTIGSTGVSAGFADVFGFPLRATYMNGVSVWNSTTPNESTLMALSSANTVAASTNVTATTTTADIRGTVSSTFASNGSSATGNTASSTGVRITILQYLQANQVSAVTASDQSAIFGVTQFSDF